MDNNNIFDGINAFCAIVEKNSFSAAARHLGHTPSHMSKEIARLERRLNVRLLNRTTRQISLTQEGNDFYNSAQQLVSDAISARDGALGKSATPSGTLKISMPVSLSHSHVNGYLAQFLAVFPKISLELETTDRMVDMVAEGFDIVVRAGHLKDNSLIAKKLSTSRLMHVASPTYLAKHQTPLTPQDLKDHTLIDFSGRQSRKYWTFHGPKNRRIKIPVSPRIVCNSAESELALAIAGTGITRLPAFVCQSAIDTNQLSVILSDYEEPPIGIYVMYPNRSHQPLKTRVFIDFIAQKFASLK